MCLARNILFFLFSALTVVAQLVMLPAYGLSDVAPSFSVSAITDYAAAMPADPTTSVIASLSTGSSTEVPSTTTITIVSVTESSYSALTTTSTPQSTEKPSSTPIINLSVDTTIITSASSTATSSISFTDIVFTELPSADFTTTISTIQIIPITINNQTTPSSASSASTQTLTSTTARFPNATTSVTFTTESMSTSGTVPTSTFTSVVTADANPTTISDGDIATARPSLADNSGISVKAGKGGTGLLIRLMGVVAWMNVIVVI
jgi:hypothetical protein